MTEVRHEDHREQDRIDMPKVCPVCGATVEETELSGTRYEGDGIKVEWKGLNGYCPNDDWVWLVAMAGVGEGR